MAISDAMEKLGRAIFEAPFGGKRISKDAPELAEVRLAILDEVKAKSHRASGKYVFPYNLVRVHLLGVPEDQASVFRSDFLAEYFSEEVRAGLARSTYRFPSTLRIEVCPTSKLPAQGEDWVSIETLQDEQKEPDAPVIAEPAKLVVLNGTANHSEIVLQKVRTNIGRLLEVYRSTGPSRRNDLAFSAENEINKTVSREHAHILRSQKTGEYRLYNDRVYKGAENSGLWIVRDDLSQPVHRSARGTLLKHGDEIHLGTAVILFQSGSV